MFFRRKLKEPDPESEQQLRDQIKAEGGLEKKDMPAMIIAAFLVILPVAIAALLAIVLFALLII